MKSARVKRMFFILLCTRTKTLHLDLCFTKFDYIYNFITYKSSYQANWLILSFFIWDLWKQNLFLNWTCEKTVSWLQLDLCFTKFDYTTILLNINHLTKQMESAFITSVEYIISVILFHHSFGTLELCLYLYYFT